MVSVLERLSSDRHLLLESVSTSNKNASQVIQAVGKLIYVTEGLIKTPPKAQTPQQTAPVQQIEMRPLSLQADARTGHLQIVSLDPKSNDTNNLLHLNADGHLIVGATVKSGAPVVLSHGPREVKEPAHIEISKGHAAQEQLPADNEAATQEEAGDDQGVGDNEAATQEDAGLDEGVVDNEAGTQEDAGVHEGVVDNEAGTQEDAGVDEGVVDNEAGTQEDAGVDEDVGHNEAGTEDDAGDDQGPADKEAGTQGDAGVDEGVGDKEAGTEDDAGDDQGPADNDAGTQGDAVDDQGRADKEGDPGSDEVGNQPSTSHEKGPLDQKEKDDSFIDVLSDEVPEGPLNLALVISSCARTRLRPRTSPAPSVSSERHEIDVSSGGVVIHVKREKPYDLPVDEPVTSGPDKETLEAAGILENMHLSGDQPAPPPQTEKRPGPTTRKRVAESKNNNNNKKPKKGFKKKN